MAVIAFDADVIIAFLDPADAQHAAAVATLRSRLAAPNDAILPTSVYAEILVRPLRAGLGDQIDRFLAEAGIAVVPIDRATARRAAELRAAHEGLRLPDALAVATALERGAQFVTLDRRLQRLVEQL